MVEYGLEAIIFMLLYSAASSSLLLINKLCLHYIHAPSFISTLQFLCASVVPLFLMATGLAPKDDWEWVKFKAYIYYVAMFVCTIYCNMKALEFSNVETIIVFRACVPLVVCLLDWGFMGRQLPSLRSFLALAVLVGGAAGYVLTDKEFSLKGWAAYTWVSAYFLVISVEMAYGKHIVGPHLKFASMWGPTMYTNVISILPMAAIGAMTHEIDQLQATSWSLIPLLWLTLSCVVGVAISYLGWRARSLVTATCYTVLGVANKMLTVFFNVVMWDQHASALGIFSLAVCLAGAAAYQQEPAAPMREAESEKADAAKREACVAYARPVCLGSAALLLLVPSFYIIPAKMAGGAFSHSSSSSAIPNGTSGPAAALRRAHFNVPCDSSRMSVWQPPAGKPFGVHVQSYLKAFSVTLSQRRPLVTDQASLCPTSQPSFVCYLESPTKGCTASKKTLATAPRVSSAEMDFSFAQRDAELRNQTKSWLSSHLLALLLKPSPRLADHLCRLRRGMQLAEAKCRMQPKVLGVQMHLPSTAFNAKPYTISTLRLLAYTGARQVLLVPSNLEQRADDACQVTTAALTAAIARQLHRNDSSRAAFFPANLASVRIACLPRAAGALLVKHGEAAAASSEWSSPLYHLSGAMLLAETDYFLGVMETDFARIVHPLMRARPAARAARAGSFSSLPQAYDVMQSSARDPQLSPPALWVPGPTEHAHTRPAVVRRGAASRPAAAEKGRTLNEL
ncbi:hypothetical protein AB1Y20_002899 [Prymnesium parvum]|uniref:EamA domain-containing protein n=1 Tax=Prymnesium parvum TaxID=97485 RepID=A0AB34JCP8_PRYPA